MDKCSLTKSSTPLPNVRRTYKDNLIVILGLCWKNQCLFRRNILFLMLAFIIPVTNFFLIRLYFGHLPVGLKVILVGSQSEGIAKSFLADHFQRMDLDVTRSENFEEAIEALRLGKTSAVIQIPDEYSINTLRRFHMGLNADNSTVVKSQLRLYQDNSNMVIGTTVYVTVLKSILNMITDATQILGAHPNSGRLPLHIGKPLFGKPDIELTHSIMIGEIPQSLFMIGLFISAMTFVKDREDRLLHRLKTCGLGPFEIMASHYILHSGLLVMQITTYLVVLTALQVDIQGSYFILILLMSLASYTGMAAGFGISVLCSRLYEAVLLSSLLQFLTLGMAGVFWPIQGTPKWFQHFCYLHPMYHIVTAFRLEVDHGIGLDNFYIWFCLPHCLLTITLLTLASGFIYNGNKLEIVESVLAFKRPNIKLPWKQIKFPTFRRRLSKL